MLRNREAMRNQRRFDSPCCLQPSLQQTQERNGVMAVIIVGCVDPGLCLRLNVADFLHSRLCMLLYFNHSYIYLFLLSSIESFNPYTIQSTLQFLCCWFSFLLSLSFHMNSLTSQTGDESESSRERTRLGRG